MTQDGAGLAGAGLGGFPTICFLQRNLIANPVLPYDLIAMRRWQLVIVVLAVPLLGTALIWHVSSKHKQEKREAGYQAALSSYTKDIKPGMTRKEVEEYLRERHAIFLQRCCEEQQHTFTDLVWIGQESAPWYCSKNNIYIAFQFAPIQQQESLKPLDSDRLERIKILPWLEDCL